MSAEKISRRKAEILTLSARLFADRGFQGTSLRDIGDTAEIRRGSLYSHFSSKEEILKMAKKHEKEFEKRFKELDRLEAKALENESTSLPH